MLLVFHQGAGWSQTAVARNCLDKSTLQRSGELVPKGVRYALAGGTVIALLPVWSDAGWFHSHVRYGEITFLRGKLSYVGRAGYAWFPSMVVMWSSETVRRKATDPLLARLDNKGLARGGRYIAAQINAATK